MSRLSRHSYIANRNINRGFSKTYFPNQILFKLQPGPKRHESYTEEEPTDQPLNIANPKSMDKKRTELKVSALRNGTVIDHIPADQSFQVVKMLNLDESSRQIYFGTNLDSAKYGKKGIIKITDKFFESEEISKIALVAPSATLIEIKDYDVTSKRKVHLPDSVEKIVKCFNPKCVTNNQEIDTKFYVTEDHKGNMKLACHFCEKTMGKESIDFF